MRTPSDRGQNAQAVTRAGQILLAFSVDRPELTVGELATLTGLYRTTVHRLVTTLESSGFLVKVNGSSRYTLGARVLQLAQVINRRLNDIIAVAMTSLVRLRDETEETAALHIREGMARIGVAQVESRLDLRRTYPDLGKPLPLHIGAPGKAILANLDEDELAAYIRTSEWNWPADPIGLGTTLMVDLREIRERGYAVSRGERVRGVASLAAPIFDARANVVGAVNVTGPMSRLDEGALARMAAPVVAAGHAISQGLGFQRGVFTATAAAI